MTQAAPQEIPVGFDLATRQFIQKLPSVSYSQNGISTVPLPNVGLLAKIGGVLTIVYTTSAAGTFANKTGRTKIGGTTPYDAISRLRVTTQGGNELYNTSMWGNYLWQRTLRGSTDYRNPLTSFGATNTAGRVFQLPTPSANSTQYTIRVPIEIPVAMGEGLQAGLMLLQNPVTKFNLEITWGNIESNLLTLTGSSITVNSATFSPYVEYFAVPARQIDYPDLSQVHMVLEDITDITSSGDFTYRAPVGQVYSAVLQEFVTSAAGLDPQYFGDLTVRYAQSQVPYSYSADQHLGRQRKQLGNIDLPDGVLLHNFGYGSGLLEYKSVRDFLDTAQITDLSLVTNISSGATISGAFCRTIRELLVPAV